MLHVFPSSFNSEESIPSLSILSYTGFVAPTLSLWLAVHFLRFGWVHLLRNSIFSTLPYTWDQSFNPCPSVWKRVPRDPVVKCLTRNSGVLGSSRTGSSGIFHGSVLGQDTSQPSLVLVKPRKA